MKYKSAKLKKLEKNRHSILTDDMNHCIICEQWGVDINEIFMGRNRKNSMKYGLCIPLCRKHHEEYHIDRKMQLYWMKIGQTYFVNKYSFDEWMDIFKVNYLYEKD